jgi:hypothetical protein
VGGGGWLVEIPTRGASKPEEEEEASDLREFQELKEDPHTATCGVIGGGGSVGRRPFTTRWSE